MSETFFNRLALHAQVSPVAPALMAHGQNPLTYAALNTLIGNTAKQLREHGLSRTDRVAVVMPNGPQAAVAILSVMAVSIVAPLNPDYKQPEFEEIFLRIGIRTLIIKGELSHPARAAADVCGVSVLEIDTGHSNDAGDFKITTVAIRENISPGWSNSESSDVALVMQTSGTTATPKVVPLLHSNLLASATNLALSLHLSEKDRCLHFLPMFHIGGIVDVLLAPLLMGGTVFCAPSFSAPDFFHNLMSFRPTWTQAVPVMLNEILESSANYPQAIAGHSLRFVRSVSAALPVDLMASFEGAFSVPIIEIYGMTETAGVITSNPLPPSKRIAGSVGLAAGGEIDILDPMDRPLVSGEIGNIVVRGHNVMPGYENAPDENERAFIHQWFRTGDQGYLDSDGYLYLVGRTKEMINRGGEKIVPGELDRVMLSNPMIADAASFAVPHPTLGEDVAALVVLKPGVANIDKEALIIFLKERVAFFKVPKRIFFVDEIPRNVNGKLQRGLLTKLYGSVEEADGGRPDYVAPVTPVAKYIAEVWADILKVDKIGMRDDFFALGGDSLKAASLINALQQKSNATLYVSSLFDAPTLEEFEGVLQANYPDLVARIFGELLVPRLLSDGRVTTNMLDRFESRIYKTHSASAGRHKTTLPIVIILAAPGYGAELLGRLIARYSEALLSFCTPVINYDRLKVDPVYLDALRRLNQSKERSGFASIFPIIEELIKSTNSADEFYKRLSDYLSDRLLVDMSHVYALDTGLLMKAETEIIRPLYLHLHEHPYLHQDINTGKEIVSLVSNFIDIDEAHGVDTKNDSHLKEMIWLLSHKKINNFLAGVPSERRMSLRLEDLVSTPEKVLSAIFDFIGYQQHSSLNSIDMDRINIDNWKNMFDIDFLCDETMSLSGDMGYSDTVSKLQGRTEFEI